jgi:hypothetical protein
MWGMCPITRDACYTSCWNFFCARLCLLLQLWFSSYWYVFFRCGNPNWSHLGLDSILGWYLTFIRFGRQRACAWCWNLKLTNCFDIRIINSAFQDVTAFRHVTMSTPMEFIRCGSSSPTSFVCKCITDFLHLLNRSLGQMFSCNSQVFDSKTVCVDLI